MEQFLLGFEPPTHLQAIFWLSVIHTLRNRFPLALGFTLDFHFRNIRDSNPIPLRLMYQQQPRMPGQTWFESSFCFSRKDIPWTRKTRNYLIWPNANRLKLKKNGAIGSSLASRFREKASPVRESDSFVDLKLSTHASKNLRAWIRSYKSLRMRSHQF